MDSLVLGAWGPAIGAALPVVENRVFLEAPQQVRFVSELMVENPNSSVFGTPAWVIRPEPAVRMQQRVPFQRIPATDQSPIGIEPDRKAPGAPASRISHP